MGPSGFPPALVFAPEGPVRVLPGGGSGMGPGCGGVAPGAPPVMAGGAVPLGSAGGTGGAGAARLKDQSDASGIDPRLRAPGGGAVPGSCYLGTVRISRDDVVHVARLARLDLDESEVETFTAQLGDILDHAARVEAADTSGVAPTAHPLPLANVLRPDEVGSSLDRDVILAEAPEAERGYFRVPRILDTGS